jgi:hypothetical protein
MEEKSRPKNEKLFDKRGNAVESNFLKMRR